MNYKVRDRVRHKAFGNGTIIAVNTSNPYPGILVEFDKHNNMFHDGNCTVQGKPGHCWWFGDDTYSLTLVKEEFPMYATKLIELARANPQEYDGKRYKVVDGALLDRDGHEHKSCTIWRGGIADINGKSLRLYASDYTQLEPLEPSPVPFMDAVNSGKDIKHISWDKYRSLKKALERLYYEPEQVATELINGEWLIKD